mmetsp:Transcript_123732/g.395933  ORF Transcript_123732/g.395933 Transcript_123732/m.395933 type:complete len:322 (+) Transcript_123732:543-1508(+)
MVGNTQCGYARPPIGVQAFVPGQPRCRVGGGRRRQSANELLRPCLFHNDTVGAKLFSKHGFDRPKREFLEQDRHGGVVPDLRAAQRADADLELPGRELVAGADQQLESLSLRLQRAYDLGSPSEVPRVPVQKGALTRGLHRILRVQDLVGLREGPQQSPVRNVQRAALRLAARRHDTGLAVAGGAPLARASLHLLLARHLPSNVPRESQNQRLVERHVELRDMELASAAPIRLQRNPKQQSERVPGAAALQQRRLGPLRRSLQGLRDPASRRREPESELGGPGAGTREVVDREGGRREQVLGGGARPIRIRHDPVQNGREQ